MLSSTPYINPALSGVAGTYPPNRKIAPEEIYAGQSGTDAQIFNPGNDRVELSPEGRKLARRNANTSSSPAERAPDPGNTNADTDAAQSGTRPEEGSTTRDSAAQSSPENETDKEKESAEKAPGVNGENLPPEEQQEVQELKRRDQEVRTHEAAHAAVGGKYAGAPSLEYETGPDGKRYAVSGEVSIDLSKVKGDPQETIDKMEQVQAAALAPAQPSAQDRRVAARAAQIAAQARMELRSQQGESGNTYAAPHAGTSPGGSDETTQQTPNASIPAVSIESLRWSGAVA
ncbi:MAG: putative metalloprotease CJM1_0395 family protein [Desulfuromonadaceae bacterium]